MMLRSAVPPKLLDLLIQSLALVTGVPGISLHTRSVILLRSPFTKGNKLLSPAVVSLTISHFPTLLPHCIFLIEKSIAQYAAECNRIGTLPLYFLSFHHSYVLVEWEGEREMSNEVEFTENYRRNKCSHLIRK